MLIPAFHFQIIILNSANFSTFHHSLFTFAHFHNFQADAKIRGPLFKFSVKDSAIQLLLLSVSAQFQIINDLFNLADRFIRNISSRVPNSAIFHFAAISYLSLVLGPFSLLVLRFRQIIHFILIYEFYFLNRQLCLFYHLYLLLIFEFQSYIFLLFNYLLFCLKNYNKILS